MIPLRDLIVRLLIFAIVTIKSSTSLSAQINICINKKTDLFRPVHRNARWIYSMHDPTCVRLDKAEYAHCPIMLVVDDSFSVSFQLLRSLSEIQKRVSQRKPPRSSASRTALWPKIICVIK